MGYAPNENPLIEDGSGGFGWLEWKYERHMQRKRSERDGRFHFDIALNGTQLEMIESMLKRKQTPRGWIHRLIYNTLKE